MSTQENNRAIAVFMGMVGTDSFLRQNYHYHSEWSLLMPVVEKIANMQFAIKLYAKGAEQNTVSIHNGVDMIGCLSIPIIQVDRSIQRLPLIESIYQAVVEFLTWYNTQNKPNVHRTE